MVAQIDCLISRELTAKAGAGPRECFLDFFWITLGKSLEEKPLAFDRHRRGTSRIYRPVHFKYFS
jgi:hypothetical protein